MADPVAIASNTLKAEPKRAKLRNEQLLPKLRNDNTLI
jgi:hypothetical protein